MTLRGLIHQDGADDTADGDTAAAVAGGDGDTEVYAPRLSGNRTFLYKEEDGTEEGTSGSSVIAGSMNNGGDNSLSLIHI